MSTPTPTPTPTRKGNVSNTFADAFGTWHAEIEAAEGNGTSEVFGCSMRTVYNRASSALHKELKDRAPRGATIPSVRVEFLGLRRRPNGTFYALFREKGK